MTTVTLASGISVEIEDVLYEFISDEVTPGTGRTAEEVFGILGELVLEFGPKNHELLAKRAERQSRIDEDYIGKRKAGWEPTTASAAQDAAEQGGFRVVDRVWCRPKERGCGECRDIGIDRVVEMAGPLLEQHHQRRRGDRLGHRIDPDQGVAGPREAALDVALPGPAAPGHAAPAGDEGEGAGELAGIDIALHPGAQAGEAAGHEAGGGSVGFEDSRPQGLRHLQPPAWS